MQCASHTTHQLSKTFAASTKAGFGKIPDLKRGKVPEDWWYFPVVARLHNERTGYPTQKPEVLLERIILGIVEPRRPGGKIFSAALAPHRLSPPATDAVSSPATLPSAPSIPLAKDFCASSAITFSIWTENKPKDETKLSCLFHLSACEVKLSGDTLPSYWEVDPDWDGTTFHSTAQAVLPLRSGEIAQSLPLPESKPGRMVCVRAVTNEGEQGQIVLE